MTDSPAAGGAGVLRSMSSLISCVRVKALLRPPGGA
jgi:hypothetical protein